MRSTRSTGSRWARQKGHRCAARAAAVDSKCCSLRSARQLPAAPCHPLPPCSLPQVVAALVARYRSLPPLLQKIEELVAGTTSGKAPRLAG